MGEQPTKPSWYNDPEGRYSHQAYWDGTGWSGETRLPKKPVSLGLILFVMGILGGALLSVLALVSRGGWPAMAAFFLGLLVIAVTVVVASVVWVVIKIRNRR